MSCGPTAGRPVYVESTASGEQGGQGNRGSFDRVTVPTDVSLEFFSIETKEVLGNVITYDEKSLFKIGYRMRGDNIDRYGVGFVAGRSGVGGGTDKVAIVSGEISSNQLDGESRYLLYMLARNEERCKKYNSSRSSGSGRRIDSIEKNDPRTIECRIAYGAEVVDGIYPDFDVLTVLTLVPPSALVK